MYKSVWSCLSLSLSHFSPQVWSCHQHHLLTLKRPQPQSFIHTSETRFIFAATGEFHTEIKFLLLKMYFRLLTRSQIHFVQVSHHHHYEGKYEVWTHIEGASWAHDQICSKHRLRNDEHWYMILRIRFSHRCCSPLMVSLLWLSSPEVLIVQSVAVYEEWLLICSVTTVGHELKRVGPVVQKASFSHN